MALLPPVVAELTANIGEFKTKMGEARSEMKRTGEEGGKGFSTLQKIGTASFVAVGAAAVAFGVEAVKAAAEGEKAHANLVNAIKNSKTPFESVAKQVDGLSDKFAAFGYQNDQVEEALTVLVRTTGNTKAAMADMGLAADLAKGKNIDLATAATIVGKVQNGNVTVLKKMGFATKDAAGHTLTAAAALKLLASRFGGAAQAQAETFAGKLAAAGARFDNLKEAIGNRLLPIVATLFDWLSRLLPKAFDALGAAFNFIKGGITDFIEGFTKGTDALGSSQTKWAQWGAVAYTIFAKVRTVAVTVFGWLTSTLFPAFAKAFVIVREAARRAFGWIIDHVWPALKSGARAVFDWFQNTAIPALVTAFDHVRDGAKTAFGWIIDHVWPALRDGAKAAFDWITNTGIPALVKAFDKVRDAGKTAFDWVTNVGLPAVGDAAQTTAKRTATAAGWIETNWPKVQAAFKTVGDYFADTVWPKMRQVFDFLAKTVGDLVKTFADRWDAIRAATVNALKIIAVAVGVALGPLIIIIKGAWQNIVGAVKVAWDFMRNIVQAGMDALKGIIDIVTGILTLNWHKVWHGLTEIVSAVWQELEAMVLAGVGVVREVIEGALGVIKQVWQAIWGFIGPWLTKNVLDPIGNAVHLFLYGPVGLVTIVQAGIGLVISVFRPIITIVGFMITNVIAPIVAAVMDFMTGAGRGIVSIIRAGIGLAITAFEAILSIVQWLVNNVINPIVSAVGLLFNGAATGIVSVFRVGVAAITTVWQGLKSMVQWFLDNIARPIGSAVDGFRDGVKAGFQAIVDGVRSIWDGLKAVAAAPVHFLVDIIYNKGIVPVVNFVGGLIGQHPLNPITLPFNTGGLVPGSGPDKDGVHAMLTPGEYVMSRKAVEYFGKSFFETVNRNGRQRLPLQLNQGGFVNPVASAVGFMHSLLGRPYDHSGMSQGPGTMDCSMAQSSLINFIYGRNPWHRLFATGYASSVLPGQGFVRGSFGSGADYAQGYQLGVRPTAGGHIGHVIGRIGGQTWESTPPVIRSPSGLPPESKPDHYFLAGYPNFGNPYLGAPGGPHAPKGGGGGGFLSGLAGAVGGFFGGVGGAIAGGASAAAAAAAKLAGLIAHIPEIVSKVKDLIGKLVGSVRNNPLASMIADVTKKAVKDSIKGIISFAGSAIPGIGPALSALMSFGGGGTVPGPIGKPRLAVVHGGEKVTPVTRPRAIDMIHERQGARLHPADIDALARALGKVIKSA